MQINLQITRRKAIQINDNGQYFDFIGGTLCNVCNVIGGQNYFFQKIQLVAYKLGL